ncbi:MAG: tryptophan synthase subunit beta, partial [Sedimentisphaerales bacterium]|nr:tryptophan synthase subunit beta [Sedimentisphaerales bacterium]
MANTPDKQGHFKQFGGRYLPETLMALHDELTDVYLKLKKDPKFQKEFQFYLKEYAGRPTNLYYAERLSKHLKTLKVYLKREDLLHTGAHKIN